MRPEHAYGTICPFIHALPATDAYHDWAASAGGSTMPLSLLDALGLANAMVAV